MLVSLRPSIVAMAALLASPAQANDTPSPAAFQADEPATVSIDTSGRPYGFGIGVVAGEPTGLTMAVRPDSNHAVQAHASWSFYRNWIRFNVDYLPTWIKVDVDGATIPIYAGIGGTLGVGDDTAWLGGRIPIGFAVHPDNTPLEPFLEVAPVLYLAPETSVGVDGAIGLRYYF